MSPELRLSVSNTPPSFTLSAQSGVFENGVSRITCRASAIFLDYNMSLVTMKLDSTDADVKDLEFDGRVAAFIPHDHLDKEIQPSPFQRDMA